MADTSNQSRLRVRYRKDGRLAYLGHLEVLGTINRSIRRSGVPFAVGNGFARRIRLQFSQALPVGASSTGEYYDLMVTEHLDPASALEMLRAVTPRGLAPDAAAYVSRRLPALEAWVNRADWDVTVHGPRSLREKGELHYMRGEKPKSIDLGRALVSWDVTPCEEGLRVLLATRSSNDGALRPQVLLDAAFSTERIAADVALSGRPTLSVCRVGQWHEGEDGNLVEPLPSAVRGA